MASPARFFAVILAAAILAVSLPAHAETPTEHVKGTVDKAIEVIGDKKMAKTAKRQALRKLMLENFDFAEVSKSVLGTHWPSDPAKQEEFTVLFVELLQRNYVRNIESVGEVKISYAAERMVDGAHAQVDSKIGLKNGGEMKLTYKLRRAGEGWKIYDMLIEGVSLVANYRAQMNKIIRECQIPSSDASLEDPPKAGAREAGSSPSRQAASVSKDRNPQICFENLLRRMRATIARFKD